MFTNGRQTFLEIGVVPGGWTGGEVGFVFGETSFLGLFCGLMDCFRFSDEVVCFLR